MPARDYTITGGKRRTLRERFYRRTWAWTGWRWAGRRAGRAVMLRRERERNG